MSDLNLFAYHPFVILGGVYEIPCDDDKNKLTDSDLEEASRRVSFKTPWWSVIFFLLTLLLFYLGLLSLNLLI